MSQVRDTGRDGNCVAESRSDASHDEFPHRRPTLSSSQSASLSLFGLLKYMCSYLLFRICFFIIKYIISATIDVTMIQWLKLVIMEHNFQVNGQRDKREILCLVSPVDSTATEKSNYFIVIISSHTSVWFTHPLELN